MYKHSLYIKQTYYSNILSLFIYRHYEHCALILWSIDKNQNASMASAVITKEPLMI